MTFVAITTLPKTTHNISTFNTGETLSNYSPFLHINRRVETFPDSHDLFKIPDVN